MFPRTVTQLMEMGFERAQVERCLQVPVPGCPHWKHLDGRFSKL